MKIIIKDKLKKDADLQETLDLFFDDIFALNAITTTQDDEIVELKQANIELQRKFSDLQSIILDLQLEQNKNHMTIWGAVKNMLKSKRVTNLSVSEVDLTKE